MAQNVVLKYQHSLYTIALCILCNHNMGCDCGGTIDRPY